MPLVQMVPLQRIRIGDHPDLVSAAIVDDLRAWGHDFEADRYVRRHNAGLVEAKERNELKERLLTDATLSMPLRKAPLSLLAALESLTLDERLVDLLEAEGI